MMNALLIFIGGGLGSISRYGLSLLCARTITTFPIATMFSNVFATLILVLVSTYLAKKPDLQWLQPLILVGFCGVFSTFSTFSLETMHLFHSGQVLLGTLNVLLSLSICFGLIYFLTKP